MDSSVSPKDEIWVVRVCHHISNAVYRFCTVGKAAGAWRLPPTLSSLEVKERVELYLYSPSGPSWLVLGWTLPLPLLVSQSSSIRLRLLPRRSGKGSRKRGRPTKYFDLCVVEITDMNLVQKRNPFCLVRPPCSFSWTKRVIGRTVSLLVV